MTKSVYVASSERRVSKSSIALGVLEMFSRQVRRVGVFRPLVQSLDKDQVTSALLSLKGVRQDAASALGVTYQQFSENPSAAIDTIVAKYAG